jgi:hypothetical protein
MRKNAARPTTMTKNPAPRNIIALCTSNRMMRSSAIGAVTNGDTPNPASVSPIASPRRPGNQLPATASGTPYANPTPTPPTTP